MGVDLAAVIADVLDDVCKLLLDLHTYWKRADFKCMDIRPRPCLDIASEGMFETTHGKVDLNGVLACDLTVASGGPVGVALRLDDVGRCGFSEVGLSLKDIEPSLIARISSCGRRPLVNSLLETWR
jgi:hypothetical protein